MGFQEGILRQIAHDDNRFVMRRRRKQSISIASAGGSELSNIPIVIVRTVTELDHHVRELPQPEPRCCSPRVAIFSQTATESAVETLQRSECTPGIRDAPLTTILWGNSLASPLRSISWMRIFPQKRRMMRRRAGCLWWVWSHTYTARRIKELVDAGYTVHRAEKFRAGAILLRCAAQRTGSHLPDGMPHEKRAFRPMQMRDTAGYF